MKSHIYINAINATSYTSNGNIRVTIYHENCVSFASKMIMEIENHVFGKKSPEKASQETWSNTCFLKKEVIASESNA